MATRAVQYAGSQACGNGAGATDPSEGFIRPLPGISAIDPSAAASDLGRCQNIPEEKG